MNSKEALERLKHWCPPIGDLTPEFDLIETDLDRLEELKNIHRITLDLNKRLETELNKYGEILRIIKEKEVNVLVLRISFISSEGVNYYNWRFPNEELQLAQEEFNLLKEWLK